MTLRFENGNNNNFNPNSNSNLLPDNSRINSPDETNRKLDSTPEETTFQTQFNAIPSKPLTTTEVIVKAVTDNGETDQQRGPDGSWKENKCTMNTFEKCLNGGYCMPKVGNCLCKRGYTGDRCELSACGPTHTLINGTES